jgi:IS30 family transposase
MIDQRPAIVDKRSRIGDWELERSGDSLWQMDTLIGRSGGPVLVTMVERFSPYTLISLGASREARAIKAANLGSMNSHREKALSTTSGNGKEFALQQLLT